MIWLVCAAVAGIAAAVIALMRLAGTDMRLEVEIIKLRVMLSDTQKRLDLLESPERRLEAKLSQPPRL